ncbi:MAG: hypothetical protein NTY79_03855 [Chloroflexi bacterium]|nr:hypothetical protein [Chloroflexota bacterium]
MKIKRFKSLLPYLAAVVIASMLAPIGVLSPLPARADAGIMRWQTVNTPNSDNTSKYDVLNPYFPPTDNFTGSEIRDLSVGNNGATLIVAITVDARFIDPGAVPGPLGIFLCTNTAGITWSASAYRQLITSPGWTAANQVYNVLIAPDDPKLWALTAGTVVNGPTEFWVTQDGGATWNNTQAPAMAAGEAIGAIDISIDYGTGRDLMLVTRSGAGIGRIFMNNTAGFSAWMQQANPTAIAMDIFASKFSPTYTGDQSFVVILATGAGTFYNIGLRDVKNNSALAWVYPGNGVGVSTSTFATLSVADLSLPSDFSGQSAGLRRAFVSLAQSGIFRIDDSVVTALLPAAGINSIQFFGTYSQGKLIAGSVKGVPCLAAVPTIYMDTPCSCPGSCSMLSLKPPTGAAGLCSGSTSGVGAAVVGWSPDGAVAYAVTGSGLITSGANWWNSGSSPWITTLVPNDESAFSISRNNGDTWNQLSLIDTTIDWFNDVTVSADCTTLYLASVHRNLGTGCNEFDSVWRSTISPGVSAPLPAIPPIGTYWERVMTHTTSASCAVPQSDLPILRTVPSCTDSSDGGVVAWAARFEPTSLSGTGGDRGGVMAWSPDYGDYWMAVTPRYPVEDFTFESSRVIYVAGIIGMVQKLVYTGTAWSTNLPGADSGVIPHTIVARNGKVLVGANLIASSENTPIAYSADSGANFQRYRDFIPVTGMVHAIFDTDFEKNRFIYAAVGDNVTGTVYRNTAPVFTRWTDNDMMDVSNGATGSDWSAETPPVGPNPPHLRGYYGIVMAFTGNGQPALYAAHDNITTNHFGTEVSNSAVCRTLEPRNGMPKPGIYWDCLDVFQPPSVSGVHFTLEPSSLKACGCCSPNTNTTLYAIDNETGLNFESVGGIQGNDLATIISQFNSLKGQYLQTPGYNPGINQGMLWAYTDCLAKKGSALRAPADKALVGADPVNGRNQQIDLSWEQLCLSTVYELQVAKDATFTLRINPAISGSSSIAAVTGSLRATMDEVNMTRPGVWLSPAALPEAGAIYFWRVRSYKSATGQIAVSPWSEARSFSVKPGFIVNTPYYGVQLLAPDNGCVSCKVRPASFSWSPWKEATRYEFVLSKDSEFKQVLKQASASSTGYEYDGTLDYDTNYFWRVRAVEINGQAIPSDWSATFSFRTESAPALPRSLPGEPATPLWVWIIIGLGTILVIVTLILILRTSR